MFLENYSLRIAKEMIQGVDLWLNTPRRGEEACGTSGMKAAINGVLNFSILDGWYDEAYESSGGWAIGGREEYTEDQDTLHASDIYSLLEQEIVPMYYRRNEENVPVEWVQRMKQCLKFCSPQYNTQRMLNEYSSMLYVPAHEASSGIRESKYQSARDKARWAEAIRAAWGRVQFLEVPQAVDRSIIAGQKLNLRTTVDLAGLGAKDVRVEAVVGRVTPDGQLERTEVIELLPAETKGPATAFGLEYALKMTAPCGLCPANQPESYARSVTAAM